MRSMVSSTSAKGIAAIVGVGPKLGRSIARKFAHEGYTVAILARDLGTSCFFSLKMSFCFTLLFIITFFLYGLQGDCQDLQMR